MALLVLADRERIDLDEPVAAYWPALCQNGKSDIPVHLVLSQRSGVAALDTAISNDDAAALEPVLRLIERQRAWWRPGTKHGYHAVTYGFIISGLIQAVTGRTVGQYFAREVAGPLGLDLHIGLPSPPAQPCGADDRPHSAPSNPRAAQACLDSLRHRPGEPAFGLLPSNVRWLGRRLQR